MHRREASTQPEVPAPTMTKSTLELWMKGRERRKSRVGRNGVIVKFDEKDRVRGSQEQLEGIYVR